MRSGAPGRLWRFSRSSSRSRAESSQHTPLPHPIIPNDSGLQCRKCKARLLKSDIMYPTTIANKEWLCRYCVQGLIEGWHDQEEAGPPPPTQTGNPMQQTIMQEVSKRLAERMYDDISAKQIVKKEE